MELSDIAGWIALAATCMAAIMTAANLGARITGFGFIVFTIGSIGWVTVAITKGDSTQLLYSNLFLTLVNVLGIWRWLGRQAAYEEGGEAATARSAASSVPTLFAVGGLAGKPVTGRKGAALGTVVDAMMRCDGAALAYLVISEGGVGGVGERLHAVAPAQLQFGAEAVACDLTPEALAQSPVLDAACWPAAI